MEIADDVQRILSDSLNGKEDVAILVDGIIHQFWFSPWKINEHREEIRGLLNRMPDQFHKSKGGGWSFLNLCNDRDDRQWGEHPDMECLCVLAIAASLGQWCIPRELWTALPGGMPYVVFDTE